MMDTELSMTMWQMYWLTRMDYLSRGFALYVCAGLLLYLTATLITAMCIDVGQIDWKMTWLHKKSIHFMFWLGWAISLLAYGAVPNTKELAAIVYVPKVLNHEKVQELPTNILDAANAWLKDQVNRTEN